MLAMRPNAAILHAMSAIIDILVNCRNAVSFIWQLLRYAGSFLWLLLQSKVVLAARSFAARTAFGTSISRANRSNQPSTPMRPPIMLHALPKVCILLLMRHSMARNGSRRKSLWSNADGVFRGDSLPWKCLSKRPGSSADVTT